ncbi:hypothetical protein [uncultured Bifidobacterium sp.]|uniref:hypothetical protein n=1 Tax=uncultured Bifidobacterium sp. TaxID=165187 RepID=UPI0026376168|nr:hypothetical protein [uncultured Bifidobacterium sp.]
MDKNLDDEIIEWSLKMAHDNPGYFHANFYELASDYELGPMIIACFGTHHVNRDAFEHAKRKHKKNRVSMVLYGLMLYTLKRTGYKVSTGDRELDDLDNIRLSNDGRLYGGLYIDYTNLTFKYWWWPTCESRNLIERYRIAMKPLIPFMRALTKGGDFSDLQTGDYKDMPLEFVIQSVLSLSV